MLDKLSAVFRVGSDGALISVFGALPQGFAPPDLSDVKDGQPVLRKLAGKLFVLLNEPGSHVIGFMFDEVPAVTQLPKLATKLDAMTKAGVWGSGGSVPSLGQDQTAADVLLGYLKARRRPKKKALKSLACDAILAAKLAKSAVVFEASGTGLKSFVFSDPAHEKLRDHIGAMLNAKRQEAPFSEIVQGASSADQDLEASTLCDALGTKTLFVHIPPLGETGYGVILVDPIETAPQQIAPLLAVMSAIVPMRNAVPWKQTAIRAASISVLVALTIYMMLPTQRSIVASAQIYPKDVEVVALQFPSFVRSVQASVGDQVLEGAALAVLSAPDIEAQRNDVLFLVASEEANAKSAFQANNYAAFVEAEARVALQKERLHQIEARLAALDVKSPISGTIIEAIAKGKTGQFLPLGTEIARVQASDHYRLRLTVPASDAKYLAIGQSGSLVLRGLNGVELGFDVTSSPISIDGATDAPSDSMVLTANLVSGDDHRLIPGLTGIARIQAGREIRGVFLTRHISEFIRVKAWTFLNLRL